MLGGKQKENNMKTTFTLQLAIGRMLVTAGYNDGQLTNAIQSYLGEFQGRQTKDETRTAVSVKEASEAKSGLVKFSEKGAVVEFTTDNVSEPGRFAMWHDSLAAHLKKTGECSGELTESIIPAARLLWLAKFKLPESAPVADVSAERPTTEHKGNGRHKGKRHAGPIEALLNAKK